MSHPIARAGRGRPERRQTARWRWAIAPLVLVAAASAIAESPMPAGYPGRGRIGIEVQPMTAELREYFGAPTEKGVLIVRVEEGRPADVARLKVGEVVTDASGEPVVMPQDLVAIVARAASGEPIALNVVRKKKTRAIEVAPDGEPASPSALEYWHDQVGRPEPALAPADADEVVPVAAPGEVPTGPAPLQPSPPRPAGAAAPAPALQAPAEPAPAAPQ
jgi:hypothetical protein